MACIPEVEVEQLKREVSLLRVLEDQGQKLVRQGTDWACRCPWHEGDETPSCIVSPASNLWHCFGCDAGGSVIDWTMRWHRVSFRHSVELLRKDLLASPAIVVAAGDAIAPPPMASVRNAAATFALDAGEQALLDQVIGFYHETLLASPEALTYLAKRGLGSRELIERYRLDFANRTLAYRLPEKQIKAGAELRGALQRVGILRESGHEHLNGSIVVPLFDEAGHVVQAYGRKIVDNLRVGTPKHLYLPGAQRGVFNREGIAGCEIAGCEKVIVCEALIDALTFIAAGYTNVTSAYGVHGLTEEIIAALQACGCRRVLLAFDRDEAGERVVVEVAPRLQAAGFGVFRVLFPKGMDANA